jgi:tetratricopeptide (TPR) repeat protein
MLRFRPKLDEIKQAGGSFYLLLFLSAVLALAASVLAGIAFSWEIWSHPPGIGIDPFALGERANKIGDYDLAAREFRAVASLRSNEGVVALRRLGAALAMRGDRAGAIEAYERSLSLTPGDSASHVAVGIILGEEGRYQEALAHSREAVRLEPENVNSLSNLGRTLLYLLEFDESIDVYHRVKSLDPNSTNALIGLGSAYAQQGDLDRAIVYFELALQIDPHSENARRNLELARRVKAER